MFQDVIAGIAANLIDSQLQGSGSEIWEQAAEDCVLARINTIRILGGLPRHRTPLSHQERASRLRDLLQFWASGCICAVDEVLFADVLSRQKAKIASLPSA